MEDLSPEKFTWVIEDFSKLNASEHYSDPFTIGGCSWCIVVFPKGKSLEHLSVCLAVADSELLPSGWKSLARFTLAVVNQISEGKTKKMEAEQWFSASKADWGFPKLFPLSDVNGASERYLVNDTLIIEVEVAVLEVHDNSEGYLVNDTPISCIDEGSGLESESNDQTEDVNGFRVPVSQSVSVKLIFGRHPDLASSFRLENHTLRTAFMSALVEVIETLCLPPVFLSDYNLSCVQKTLIELEEAGLQLDWLKIKLEDVLKRKEQADRSRVVELYRQIELTRELLLNLEDQLEKEKVKVAAAKNGLSFTDIV